MVNSDNKLESDDNNKSLKYTKMKLKNHGNLQYN